MNRVSSYGQHLVLRISKIQLEKNLDNPEHIKIFLEDMVKSIGMNILAGPLTAVENPKEEELEKKGCSGIILLYESHASIHTYSNLKEAFIDIFSCRNFSYEVVFQKINEYFGTFEIKEMNFFERGYHWINIKEAFKEWHTNR